MPIKWFDTRGAPSLNTYFIRFSFKSSANESRMFKKKEKKRL